MIQLSERMIQLSENMIQLFESMVQLSKSKEKYTQTEKNINIFEELSKIRINLASHSLESKSIPSCSRECSFYWILHLRVTI